MMSIETARERPVEMVLSGPAASLMGGKALAKIDDCIVVDMGGTSTDIAVVGRGVPPPEQRGALPLDNGGPGSKASTSGPAAWGAIPSSRWTITASSPSDRKEWSLWPWRR